MGMTPQDQALNTYVAADTIGMILNEVYGVRIIHEGSPEDCHYSWKDHGAIPMTKGPLELAKWFMNRTEAGEPIEELVCYLIAHYNLMTPYLRMNREDSEIRTSQPFKLYSEQYDTTGHDDSRR